MLSYYVIISNNVVCFTAYKILQINYRQLIILSINVLRILGFVLLQRSIITYVSFLNFANLHLPVSLTCSFQWWCPCSLITFSGSEFNLSVLARPWSNDECREGVRGGGGRLRHVVKLSLVPRAKLNLHAFCSHIHRVNTKSIVNLAVERGLHPSVVKIFCIVASTVP